VRKLLFKAAGDGPCPPPENPAHPRSAAGKWLQAVGFSSFRRTGACCACFCWGQQATARAGVNGPGPEGRKRSPASDLRARAQRLVLLLLQVEQAGPMDSGAGKHPRTKPAVPPGAGKSREKSRAGPIRRHRFGSETAPRVRVGALETSPTTPPPAFVVLRPEATRQGEASAGIIHGCCRRLRQVPPPDRGGAHVFSRRAVANRCCPFIKASLRARPTTASSRLFPDQLGRMHPNCSTSLGGGLQPQHHGLVGSRFASVGCA